MESLEERRLLAVVAADPFESGSFQGGTDQWAADSGWTASGDATIRSDTSPANGSYHARLRRSSGDLQRVVDVSDATDVHLQFAAKLISFENSDRADVKVSGDGTNWATIKSFINGDDDGQYHAYDLAVPDVGDTLYVRFDAGMSGSADYWFIDDVQVTGTIAVQPSLSISDATVSEGDKTPRFIDDFISDGVGGLQEPSGLLLGSDGNLYVGSGAGNAVLRFNAATGEFVDVFVSAASGGLDNPHSLTFGPDGNLYVTSRRTDEVLRYDGTTGAFMDAFVSAGSGGLDNGPGLVFGPDGNLYVTSRDTNQVLRYDGATGAFMGTFVTDNPVTTTVDETGGLDNPHGLVFGPDGNLYVNSQHSAEVLRYNGTTGALIDAFVTANSGGLVGPTDLAFGPDNNLYVGDAAIHAVLRYQGPVDVSPGAYIDAFAERGSGGLTRPRGLLFDADSNLYVSSRDTNQVLRYGDSSQAVFTATLSAPSALPVTVDFTTADQTAATGVDYAPVSGKLTFAPGETTKTIVVASIDDSDAEADETFSINLSNPVGTTIVDGTGVGTIIDDDPVTQTPLAAFMPLGFLPGKTASNAQRMSADGRFVVGNSEGEAYRWSHDAGMIDLGTFKADDVSDDGSVVVGGDGVSNGYRWENGVLSVVGDLTIIGRTEDDPGGTRMASIHGVSADGSVMVGNTKGDVEADSFRIVGSEIQPIGDLPGGAHNSGAKHISADGSIVVGRGRTDTGNEAYLWEDGNFTPLGDLPGGAISSLAWSVSENGQFVVGQGETAAGVEAYLWSSETGMVGLGYLPGETSDSRARGVSGDGSIVVGLTNTDQVLGAFIWDQANGMRSLQSVLIAEYGLGDVLAGWTLNRALAISEDGLVIAGHGTNPSGLTEAFIVDLGNQPPVVNAGADQSVVDTDNSGSEVVTVVGSGSDPGGTIATYQWTEGNTDLGTTATISPTLSIGTHTLTLTVTDDGGGIGMDTVVVTVLAAPSPVVLFEDSFEVGSNSNDWNSKWVEDSQNDFFRSTQRSTDGVRSAEVDGRATNATLTQSTPVDLSGFASTELTFDWLIESGFDNGEYVSLDVSSNGGVSWTQDVRRLGGNVDTENTWHNESVDLTAFASSNLLVRFRSYVSSSREDANIDNVKIVGSGSISGSLLASPAEGSLQAAYSVIDPPANDPMDISGDGSVTPLDALQVINHLSRFGRAAEGEQPSDSNDYDINGDGKVSAMDALVVINRLNRQSQPAHHANASPLSPSVVDALWSDSDEDDEDTWGLIAELIS